MREAPKGVLAIAGACVIWGLSPIYYKLLSHVPPLEVLSHRTLWSLVFFGAVLGFQGRQGDVFDLISHWRALMLVAVAALMISVNWFVFILSIQVGLTVESSLGYFMFPLVAVLLGRVVFQERFSLWIGVSVMLAASAVILLTIGLGVAPWISLILAVTFAIYGVLKKLALAGPVVSVTAEVLVLAPAALIWIWGVHFAGWQGFAGREGGVFAGNWRDSLLLILSGPLTASPLILFSYAARRVTLATLGLVNYLNPSLQFFCAVVIFAEPFTRWHAVAFAMIWLALAIFSTDAIRQERAARRASASASPSSASVT